MACIAEFPGPPGRNIARRHVSVGGIHPLEEIIPLFLRNLIGWTLIPSPFRQPDPPVIAKTFAHERQLALEGITARNARGMDLGEAGVGEEGALSMGTPNGAGVGFQRIG